MHSPRKLHPRRRFYSKVTPTAKSKVGGGRGILHIVGNHVGMYQSRGCPERWLSFWFPFQPSATGTLQHTHTHTHKLGVFSLEGTQIFGVKGRIHRNTTIFWVGPLQKGRATHVPQGAWVSSPGASGVGSWSESAWTRSAEGWVPKAHGWTKPTWHLWASRRCWSFYRFKGYRFGAQKETTNRPSALLAHFHA